MNKIIGVTELQRKFRTIFDEVVHQQSPYILTRGSRPEAVILPYDKYIEYLKLDRAEVQHRFDQLLAHMAKVNAHFTDEEVERDLEEATRIVRARRRAREQRAAFKANSSASRKTKK